MTMNGVYQLPFARGNRFLGGWEIAGIATARTGLPVNITITRKASALPDQNTSGQRPNLVPGVPIYPANQTISHWFNPAAFQAPANGTWGNLGRYAARGPGNYEIDSSLQKQLKVTDRLRFNIRAAAFNLLNHPQFSGPNGNRSSLTHRLRRYIDHLRPAIIADVSESLHSLAADSDHLAVRLVIVAKIVLSRFAFDNIEKELLKVLITRAGAQRFHDVEL